METNIACRQCLPIIDPSAINVVIIYEDSASGARARSFAGRLAEKRASGCRLSASICRCELLEYPPIADEAARRVADCDYLIVSQRGDHAPAFATRQWIEAQLDEAGGRGLGLIVLSGASDRKWHVVEATRRYFRAVCATKDAVFFAHTVTTPEDEAATASRDGGATREPAVSTRRWGPARLHA